MTYDVVANFSQVTSLLFFIALFIGVLAYALWPSNKKKFYDASKIPLRED